MKGGSSGKVLSIRKLAALVVLAALAMPALPGGPAAGAPEGPAGAAAADEPWWDYSWHCRREVTISNANAAKAVRDCQLFMNVTCYAGMNADFSDMRFAQYNQTSGACKELPYYIEQKTDGSKARVVVKATEIKAGGPTSIYLYYSNPSASSASDITGAYHCFESFDTDPSQRWTVAEGSAAWDSANKWYSITNTNSYSDTVAFRAVETAMEPVEDMEVLMKVYLDSSSSTHDAGPLGRMVDNNNGYGIRLQADDCFSLRRVDNGNALHIGYVSKTFDLRTWYWVKLQVFGSTIRGRAWAVTVAEPAGWDNSVNDNTHSGPGHFGVVQDRGGPSRFDDIRVAKLTPAEPSFSFGDEERPYKFLGAECSAENANEGDVITLNVTFNNPTSEQIAFNLTFWQGPELADAEKIREPREVALEPGRDTLVQETWKAVGGETVLWVTMGKSVLASFPISVNWYPKLDIIPDQQLLQDQPCVLRFTAKDKGGDTLAWKEDCPLFNFTKTNSTGAEASMKPTNDQVGRYAVTVTVTDSHGCSDSRPFNLTVENINDPPWLEYIPGLVAYEDARYSYRVNATDPDLKWGDTLTFSDDCGLFDIDQAGGNFSFVPTNAQAGKYYIEISVRDNQSVSMSRTFNLTVQNTNDPPVMEPIAPQTATQGKLWQVMARASDIDQSTPQGDKLRFGDDSPLFDISPESGLITFTPGNGHVGAWACNITATDMAGASSSTRLELTVLNVNDPPALESIPDQTATEEVPFEYTAKASDPDVPLKLDNLTFADDSPLFDIDPKTGMFSFSPTNAQVGKHTIRITVKDESGASAGRTFLLTVVNVNDPPFNVSITSLSPGAKYRAGQDIWLNGTGADEDAGDRLTYVWLDNEVEVGRGKSVQVKLGPGDHKITLKVSDGTAEATSDVTIKVAKASTEQVTVQNDWWIPVAIAVVAAAGVGGALVAMKRSRRKDDEMAADRVQRAGTTTTAPSSKAPPSSPPSSAAAAGAASAGAATATAAPVKPGDKDKRDRARKAISAAEDAVADALEAGADTAAAEESLDIARDFFKDGDYDEAITYAREAEGALKPAARKAGKGPGPASGKLACPECGEDLQPEWPACPVCGHRTR